MKQVIQTIHADLKRLSKYHMFHFVTVLSFLFAMIIAFFPDVNASNFIYLSIFVLPVIVFSISLFIEREEGTLFPLLDSQVKLPVVILSKMISSLIIQIIPLFFYLVVFLFIQKIQIAYFSFVLIYILGCIVHILIGISLSIISKNQKILSLSYLTYILVFSMIPILYTNGLVPIQYQYVLMISPAYLSGVLVDNILSGIIYSSPIFITICVLLQIVYGIVLMIFVIIPFFKQHILDTTIR